MRSIIVEGMDGSGKDTLIGALVERFPDHTLHERASTSIGGPIANLAQWVAKDAKAMHSSGPWIYNRHPLISELIYAPRRTVNPGLSEPWTNAAWVAAYRRLVARESVVVICQPPFDVVRRTLERQGADSHMPGVYQNQGALYREYAKFVWSGRLIRYDYTKDTVNSLVHSLSIYAEVTNG